jgi:hypothetical protein
LTLRFPYIRWDLWHIVENRVEADLAIIDKLIESLLSHKANTDSIKELKSDVAIARNGLKTIAFKQNLIKRL